MRAGTRPSEVFFQQQLKQGQFDRLGMRQQLGKEMGDACHDMEMQALGRSEMRP